MVQAQETNEVEKLDQRLKQIQESFEKQQREMRENFERLIREQQAQIEALKKQLASIPTNAVAATTNAAPAAAVTPKQFNELSTKVDQMVEGSKQVRPGAFNPSIGLVG
jgi:chromosome segregation ATPase